MAPKDHLIVGLDVADIKTAEEIVRQLDERVDFYKIGYQLAFNGGLEFARDLVASGRRVFLDMKLLDIDNTIASAVENIVKIGVSMATLHAYPKAMAAAVKAAEGSDICLLGVSVLTSMDDDDLANAGYQQSARELVLKRAAQARDAHMGGVVASAQEASAIRQIIGDDMAIVTPGIRPNGFEKGDQKRVMTPGEAIRQGASHLVVARPIIQAADRAKVAQTILNDIDSALKSRLDSSSHNSLSKGGD